jgi:hypothetical protein
MPLNQVKYFALRFEEFEVSKHKNTNMPEDETESLISRRFRKQENKIQE